MAAWAERDVTAKRRNAWRATTACWVLLAVGLAIGCIAPVSQPDAKPSPSPQPAGQGPGGREQPLGLSPNQELGVGRQAYRHVMDEYGSRVLSPSNSQVLRTRTIAGKIAKAAEIEPLQREINLRLRGYRFEWEANVIQDNQVNAFCLPGGRIFVFTGILPVAQDDDQLATVMAHEVAHALAHHASERIAREQSGAGVLRSLKYNRDQETEADHIGIFLMTFAGYDPHKAVTFWERMQQRMGGQHPPEFLSDHPSDEHRIEAMKKWVPKALAGKKAFDRGDIAPAPPGR
jgi:metalloendopeptidase OMA1, mitochondrial